MKYIYKTHWSSSKDAFDEAFFNFANESGFFSIRLFNISER